jgi:hypothetical protein
MDTVGEALDVVGRPPWGRAVTGKIQREDPPAGVDAGQLGQRGPPQAAIEGQAVEQHQRRPVIGEAVVVGSQPGQGPGGTVPLCCPQPGRRYCLHLHDIPVFFLRHYFDTL